MSVPFQRIGGARDWCHGKKVSPFYRTSQLAHSEDFDFLVWFHQVSDAVDDSADVGKERTSVVSTPSLAELYKFAMNFLLVRKRKRKRNRDGRKRGK